MQPFGLVVVTVCAYAEVHVNTASAFLNRIAAPFLCLSMNLSQLMTEDVRTAMLLTVISIVMQHF